MSSTLVADLLTGFDKLTGAVHAGFRPAHAKGLMYGGTFTPSPEAAKLTRAPHAKGPATKVTVRFSASAGIPCVADNDPTGAAPQGAAVRFHLGEHEHTDVIAHSHNGFPVRTGEEFLEFIRAATANGSGGQDPPPIVAFLAAHPAAKTYVETPKSLPTSFARQAYFAVTAFRFTNAAGESRFGRFRLVPDAGLELLKPGEETTKRSDYLAAEMSQRLDKGPAKFRLLVQLAEAGDDPTNATVVWPENRPMVEFGTINVVERVDELAPELWKIIFDPVPRVDGIDSAGDPLTQIRADLYLASGRRRRAAAVQ